METTIDTTLYPDTVIVLMKETIGKLVTNNVKETVFTPKRGKPFSYMVYLPPNSIKEKFTYKEKFPYILKGDYIKVLDVDGNTLVKSKIIEYREEVLGDVIYME